MVRFLSLLLLLTNVSAQTLYCGQDTGLSAKVTLSNMCTYSEEIDNAAWTKSNTTVSANSVTAPDGALTADTVTNAATTTTHGIYSAGITVVAGSVYRQTVYLKYGTYAYALVRSQSPSTASLGVNLSTGIIEQVGASILTYSITPVGNGWYKVQFTYTKAAGVTDYVTVNLTPSTYATSTYLGAITQYIYMWGASLQLASSPADYIATTTPAVTLAGVCASGTTQSPTDPSQCIVMSDRGREIRTQEQIAVGSQ